MKRVGRVMLFGWAWARLCAHVLWAQVWARGVWHEEVWVKDYWVSERCAMLGCSCGFVVWKAGWVKEGQEEMRLDDRGLVEHAKAKWTTKGT
jgi:hypothetical protein